MNVFVVLRGEKSEGGVITGVFADELKAIEHALAQPYFTAGPWQQVDDMEWESGCDFVRVEEHQVSCADESVQAKKPLPIEYIGTNYENFPEYEKRP